MITFIMRPTRETILVDHMRQCRKCKRYNLCDEWWEILKEFD